MTKRLTTTSPKRWTLIRTTDGTWISGEHDDIGGPAYVREDKVTEQDVERLARRLAQIDGEEADYEFSAGPVRDYHQGHARELLSLVLGGKAVA